ncbi:hypothetical protein QVD99_003391 [Batrachochytrium dendrobatidis]|nr:hypothetical protein QVD99_003391 [Batrachochytrium dendrobatidis]
MFSRAIGRCCYSTHKAASKLWVKHNGGPSAQVSTKSCINIDDFADKVKQKLNTNNQVALYTSINKEALDPGLSLKELLKLTSATTPAKSPCLSKSFLLLKTHLQQKPYIFVIPMMMESLRMNMLNTVSRTTRTCVISIKMAKDSSTWLTQRKL